MPRRPKTAKSVMDADLAALVDMADKRALVQWGCWCARRVLPEFEAVCPKDPRPRAALAAARDWIRTGRFSMAVIRKAALDAHAAARALDAFSPAHAAARAAGQAVGAAHAGRHALAAAIYAVTVRRNAAGEGEDSQAAVERERRLQYRNLEGRLRRKNGKTGSAARKSPA